MRPTVDPRVIARARALGQQARASSGGNGRRRVPPANRARVVPWRPPVLIASMRDPETEGYGSYVEMPDLGALPLVGALLPSLNLSGAASTLSLGLIKGSKDPGRLRTNATAYNAAISGNRGPFEGSATPLAFLLRKSPKSKGGEGGWATAKAQNDAWAKYTAARQVLAGQRPATPAAVPLPRPPAPVLISSAGTPVGVPQILQQGAQDLLTSAGVLPPAPTYTPGYAQDLPGYQPGPFAPAPAGDGTDADRSQNLGLWLALGGLGLVALSRSGRR